MFWKLVEKTEFDMGEHMMTGNVIHGVCSANNKEEAQAVFEGLRLQGLIQPPQSIIDNYDKCIVEADEGEYVKFLEELKEW